jgi:tetratricopeptide (TPR) repeat protein
VHGNLAHRGEVAHPAVSKLGDECRTRNKSHQTRAERARAEREGVERVFLSNRLTSRGRALLGRRWLRLVAKACVVLMLTGAQTPALAQEPAPEPAVPAESLADPSAPPHAAMAHYEKGRALYLAGRYREAVGELESALTLDPNSPNLVYNLAHVYELLGEIDLAIRHYRHYRDLLTDADKAEIARVEGTLQRLVGARDEVIDPPPPPPPKLPPERGVADAAFWTLTTLAVGGLVAGGVLGGMALDAERDAKRFVLLEADDIHERQDKIDRADRVALASDISLLAGAVLGTTAILLFALRTKPASQPTQPATAAARVRGALMPSLAVDTNAKGAFLLFRGQL